MNSNINENSSMSFMEMLEKMMVEKYGKIIVDHATNPRNYKKIKDASGYISHTGPCGDTMEIWVKITDKIIEDITFLTDGCDFTRATGSMLTELAKGKGITDALKITPLQIEEALGGLPEDHKHCALLAKDALYKAIENYNEYQILYMYTCEFAPSCK